MGMTWLAQSEISSFSSPLCLYPWRHRGFPEREEVSAPMLCSCSVGIWVMPIYNLEFASNGRLSCWLNQQLLMLHKFINFDVLNKATFGLIKEASKPINDKWPNHPPFPPDKMTTDTMDEGWHARKLETLAMIRNTECALQQHYKKGCLV